MHTFIYIYIYIYMTDFEILFCKDSLEITIIHPINQENVHLILDDKNITIDKLNNVSTIHHNLQNNYIHINGRKYFVNYLIKNIIEDNTVPPLNNNSNSDSV